MPNGRNNANVATHMAFWKYCATCGEVFGSNDIDEFLKMVQEHKCQGVAG